MNKELEKILKETEKEHKDSLQGKLEHAEKKFWLKEALPDVGIKWRTFFHDLYSSVAHVSIDYDWFAYGKDKKQPDYTTVVEASKKLVPVPMTMCRDSCLSFRPKSHVDALPEEKKERWREEVQITPFTLKFSCFQHSTVKFYWFTLVEKIGIVTVSITLPLKPEIATLYAHYDSKGSRHQRLKSDHVKNMVFTPNNDNIYTIFDEEGVPYAEMQPSIKWGSGSPETPNDFTLYWLNHRLDKDATLEQLLRPLMQYQS